MDYRSTLKTLQQTRLKTKLEEKVREFDIVNRTNIELENGTITYTINDENGKISINSTSKIILNKLLAFSGVKKKIDQDTISDSILDWIDTDKNHHINGAEDDYYSSPASALLCKKWEFSNPQRIAESAEESPKKFFTALRRRMANIKVSPSF